MATHITVTAPEGRMTPINPADGNDPAGGVLLVTSDRVARVRYSGDVRASIRCGDLIPCSITGTHLANAQAAACDKPLADGDIIELREPEAAVDAPTFTTDATRGPVPAFDTSDKE